MHIDLANFRPYYSHRKLQPHALKIALKKKFLFQINHKNTKRKEGQYHFPVFMVSFDNS